MNYGRLASPSNLLPLKCRCLIVMGTGDYIVPPNLIETFAADCIRSASNARFVASLADGDVYSATSSTSFPTPEVLKLKGSDHFMVRCFDSDSCIE